MSNDILKKKILMCYDWLGTPLSLCDYVMKLLIEINYFIYCKTDMTLLVHLKLHVENDLILI